MFVRDIQLVVICPGSSEANTVAAVAMYRMFPDGTGLVDQVGVRGISAKVLLNSEQLEGLATYLAETHAQEAVNSSGR